MRAVSINTLDFVCSVMQYFAEAQIMTWLCGGWAEELWQMSAPQPHRDIDLLYPAQTFEQLDRWISTTRCDLLPVEAKRFSHKRAMLSQQIMIEVFLLEPQGGEYVTNFFNGTYQVVWPSETLTSLPLQGGQIAVASRQALQLHRHHHPSISQAYQTYQQQQTCSNLQKMAHP
jgi:hypothetical protein